MGLLNYGLEKTANLIRDEIGMEKQALNFQAINKIYKNRLADKLLGVPGGEERFNLFLKRLAQRNNAANLVKLDRGNKWVDAMRAHRIGKEAELPENVVDTLYNRLMNAGARYGNARDSFTVQEFMR